MALEFATNASFAVLFVVSGITIVDSKKLFQAEVKNPEAHKFVEAIGFAIYSNTKRTQCDVLQVIF
jgi:hypothetical protein